MRRQTFTRFTSIIFTIVIFTLTVVNVSQMTYAQTVQWPTAPETLAGSAILIDADTGAILYDKSSHMKAYPASMTKIMTGLLTIENCSFDEVVTFSSEAARSVVQGDSNISTKVGEQYTVEQSLYALLLSSANEVAYGLAEHVGGSLSGFVNLMNTKAKELGALNTHFNNASGLSDPNHYTTAYDMAMIGRASFSNGAFLSIDSYTGSYKLGSTNLTSVARILTGSNLMFKGRQFYYEYCKGSKTGFTDESGYTLISYAEKDGMRLICVVMKEANINDRYMDTKDLFEYGFNNFKKVSISNSDMSSLFNSSNYYDSEVYGNNNISFSFDASYIDLPNAAKLSDIGLKVDSSATGNIDDPNYAAKLNFIYNGKTVGSSSIIINKKNTIKSENLPYLASNNSSVPISKKSFVINVWYLGIGIGIILILQIIMLIRHLQQMKRRKRYH
ncbi:D-alanyl-D-alanine carboxypeptidase/D-alanyl-D-alanine carboxypeptidase (penicillin-binding protein 5/6) [[Clostridium] fimetarium]|uniref:D-alanyl-D-alanine carboxypeptidase/D-alanyl-D-alanine carboxypeptidase (Penicillin-binding protein 5/6) n=2 Tax=[Clostridium] fimetarium TaxID=99656 RepID=A0A1I0RWD0_9FIRM|nr:D-alanyl-D-alanine carboxypeptidase/D-alanyl-D-alanine carboxypeptidase (penicillin-binding protein 5/6) [[Clostridium] fimetarium]